MFCFAGLVGEFVCFIFITKQPFNSPDLGMGIESKRVRKWLAASTFASLQPTQVAQDAVAEPPSYIASFNPFPALVIGVTGAAMAAHAQTYLFQVSLFRSDSHHPFGLSCSHMNRFRSMLYGGTCCSASLS